MTIALEHFNCKDCENNKFNVVLFKGSFLNTTVKNIICTKCGLIYDNVPLASKKKKVEMVKFRTSDGWVSFPKRKPKKTKS